MLFGNGNRVLWASMLISLAGCAAETASPEDMLDDGDLPAIGGKGDWIENRPQSDLHKRWRGQSDFVSTAPSWDWGPMRAFGAASPTAEGGAADSRRTVEEADVYRYDTTRDLLFVLNAYRGLQVVDIANVDAPRLLSRADLGGYPIDMYQRGNHAYVLLNAINQDDTDGYYGAVLRVYDLSNELSPVATAEFKVPGSVTGSRLLATEDGSSVVIYTASQVYTTGNFENGRTWEPHTHVQSIDVTDPFAPRVVNEVSFPGSSSQVHVTPETFFLTQYNYNEGNATTKIRYVDISDRRGQIVVRGEAEVEGTLSWGDRGELQLDYANGYLRVASQISRWGAATTGGRFETNVRVTTIDVRDGNNLKAADVLDVAQGERLIACRFTEKNAYLFHMVQVDPLEILDLSNPEDIKSLSILPIPGSVSHIEARGDRLIALGQDGGESRRLAMMMFDVSNPAAPRELSRATTGEGWAWTNANYDLKSFRVLDDQHLVLLPVSETKQNGDNWEYRQFLQLFSFDTVAGTIQTRGTVDNVDGVRRAFPAHDRLVAFSDRQLQVVDVQNADMPRATGSLELARDVQDFVTVGGFGLMLVNTGDWNTPKAELRAVSLHNPDETDALGTVALNAPANEMHLLDGDVLALLGTDSQGATVITTVDVSDPVAPAVMGSMRTGELGFNRWGRGIMWRPAPGPDHVFVGNSLVMFGFATEGEAPGSKLRVIDLSNPAFPHQSASVDLGEGTVVDMREHDGKLYVSSYNPLPVTTPAEPTQPVGTADPASGAATAASLLPGGMIRPWRPRSVDVKYYLRVVDLANPARPSVSSAVNVPGRFAGLSQMGRYTIVYTMDMTKWDEAQVTAFDTMVLTPSRARLLDVFGLPQGTDSLFVDGQAAFYTPVDYNPVFLPAATEGEAAMPVMPVAPTVLQAIDLSRPDTIRSAGQVLGTAGRHVWRSLASVQDSLAFVNSGYGRLSVYDVSNVDAPALRGDYQVSGGWWSGRTFLADDGRLYLPAGMNGLQVLDTRR